MRTLWVTAIVTIVGCTLATAITIFVVAHDLFFLALIGVLFAVFLCRCASGIKRYTRLPRGLAVMLTLVLLLAMIGGGSALFGFQLHATAGPSVRQFETAVTKLQEFVVEAPLLHRTLYGIPIVKKIVGEPVEEEVVLGEEPPLPTEIPEEKISLGELILSLINTSWESTFNTSWEIIVGGFVAIAIGTYIAFDPDPYWKGTMLLFPQNRRARVTQILCKLEKALWRWLVGRLAVMAIVGASTGLLLALLGVPMAVTVGLITAALMFIPNIGAVLALGIAAILAFSKGWETVVLVVILYSIMILFEGFVVTPLIQKRQVSIPPALLIGVQTLAGLVFGFLGLAIASPLTAAVMVIIKEAYLKDTLGDTDAAVLAANEQDPAPAAEAIAKATSDSESQATAEATG